MRIKRRDFLKVSVAAGAVAALGGLSLNAFAADKERRKGHRRHTAPGEWIPSTCQGCTAWCPVEFFVQAGRAVKVRGNQLSKANNGYCCPRGHLMLQQVYDPDRIKVPMKRTNPEKGRGIDPKFVPITWDEALDTVADKMMELRKANEPEKLMYMRGRYSSDLHRSALRHTAQDLRHSQLLLPQRYLRRGGEDGARLHPGFLRLPGLRSGQDHLPGDLGQRPAQLQPTGAQRHQSNSATFSIAVR